VLGLFCGLTFLSAAAEDDLIRITLTMLATTLILSFSRFGSFKLRWYAGLAMLIAIALLGLLSAWAFHLSNNHKLAALRGAHLVQGPLVGVVVDLDCGSKGECKGRIRSYFMKRNNLWEKIDATVALYFQDGGYLEVGDLILTSCKLTKITAPLNPNEFDYQLFMQRKGISHAGYVKTENLMVLSKRYDNSCFSSAKRVRKFLLDRMKDFSFSPQVRNVVAALVFGDKSDLGAELKDKYAISGVMHVLAVSGMHVGTFYILFTFSFSLIRKFRWGRLLSFCCVLVLLWGYCFVTGLTPSVLRACVMYTILLLGQLLQERSCTFNLLAASAFALLMYSPVFIFNVGFLLSYSAVLGILLFYPLFSKAILTVNTIFDQLISLGCVSVAAQISTLPICLYVFHQFPNYFLIGNFLVIPMAILSFYLALSFFIFHWALVVAQPLSLLLEFLVSLLNKTVYLISQLPFSVVENIQITVIDVVLIYGLVMVLFLCMKSRKVWNGIIFLLLLGILYLNRSWWVFIHRERVEVYVYAIKNHQAIDFIQGKQFSSLVDSALAGHAEHKMNYHLKNNRVSKGLTAQPLSTDFDNRFLKSAFSIWKWGDAGFFICCGQHRIAVINKAPIISSATPVLRLNTLIIGNNLSVQSALFFEKLCFDQLIVDGSVSKWRRSAWQEACKRRGLVCINVMETGAVRLQFN
jgi:competence protein ComEC